MKSKFKENIKNLLRESFVIKEDSPKEGPSPSSKDNTKNKTAKEIEARERKDSLDVTSKHDTVKSLLDNEIINHAGVIFKLWGDKEASNRSLFRKKLNRELNDNGTPYTFDDEELVDIISILTDTSRKIDKAVNNN